MQNNNNNNSLQGEQQQQQQQCTKAEILGIDRKFLECGLCLDLFVEPRRLPCSHVFCTSCLLQLRASSFGGKNSLQCPECQKRHYLAVERMMVDYLVKGMVESSFQLQRLSSEEKLEMEAEEEEEEKAQQHPVRCHFMPMRNQFDNNSAVAISVSGGDTLTCMRNDGYGAAQAIAMHDYTYDPNVPADRYILHFWETQIISKGDSGNIWIGFGTQLFDCSKQYWDEALQKWTRVESIGTNDQVGAGLVLPPSQANDEHGWVFFTINGSVVEHHVFPLDELPLKSYVWLTEQGTQVTVNFGQRPFSIDVNEMELPFLRMLME